MNRLFPAAPPSKSHHQATAQVQAARVKRPHKVDLPFSLFAPLHYEANYAYPLLVWLHNDGGNERQLHKVMPLISTRNYVGLALRGLTGEDGRYAWPQSAQEIAAAEDRLWEGVERAASRFNVDASRIFLAGYEAGGTMALRLALRQPRQFAGAMSINGPFPAGNMPLARLCHVRKFPLLMAHCRDSETYTIDHICQELKLFHAAGLSVTLRQYPCGDELTTKMLHDVDVWTMQQVTGAVVDEDAVAPQPSDWN